jgi:hypothetical protein
MANGPRQVTDEYFVQSSSSGGHNMCRNCNGSVV